MKKILAIGFWLLAVSGWAQSVEFWYQGEKVEAGGTVSVAAEEDMFGEMSCETNPSTAPWDGLVLRCAEPLDGTVTAQLQIVSNTLNAAMMQWCMGGECTLVGSKTMLTKTFNASEKVQVLFDATNITGDGELLARLEVTYKESKEMVYISLICGEPAKTLSPSLPRNGEGVSPIMGGQKGGLYDLSGRKISNLQSQTSNLPKGIYIKNGKKVMIK